MTDTTVIQSPEILKAELTLALSKEGLAYQSILQSGNDIKFTRDNIELERPKLAELEKVEKGLKGMTNPFTARWKAWNAANKSLLDPVSELVTKNKSDLAKIANEIAAEKKKQDDEAARVKGIKDSIDNFFLEQSNAIAAAKTPEELTRIEKLIGSHKANSSRYAEFLPDLVIKASLLTPMIKGQKDALKKLQGLQEAEIAAGEIGDDQAILDAREAQEQITAKIEETKQNVQGTALNMATEANTVTADPVLPFIAPKRKLWKYIVVDIKAAEKAGLTLTVIDQNKVIEILKKKREAETEVTENGIRYYQEKSY